LTLDDGYYHAGYSRLTLPLPSGARIYAHVDSAGDVTYGGVREDHEILALGYNNIAMAIVGTEMSVSTLTGRAGAADDAWHVYKLWERGRLTLPARP
jgi:hypothetical protein